jgi:hypothetical protein
VGRLIPAGTGGVTARLRRIAAPQAELPALEPETDQQKLETKQQPASGAAE